MVSQHDGIEAAELPGKQDPAGWRTLHPLTPLLKGGLFVLVITGLIVANLRDYVLSFFFGQFDDEITQRPPESSEGDWAVDVNIDPLLGLSDQWLWPVLIGAALLVLAVIAGSLWLDWRMKTFRVTDEAVESRSGVLVKKYRRAPLDRVQGINLQRPLLARLAGLTTLEVNTAGSDGKVALSYLSHSDATQIRGIIMERAAATRTVEDASAELSDEEHSGVDNDPITVPVPRLIASVFLSWEVLVPLALFAAAIVLGTVVGRGFLFLLLPFIVIAGGTWFNLFTKGMKFRITETPEGVRVSSGLLSTVADTIPLSRIHAIEVRQPFFWRPMGWWQVRVTTAGLRLMEVGQSGSKNIMLPVGKKEDALRVFDALMPRHGLAEAEKSEALLGVGEPFNGSPTRAWPVLLWGQKRNGVLLKRPEASRSASVMIRRGWFTRKLTVVPLVRFQSLAFHRGLIHRILRLAAVEIHTVLGPINARVNGLDQQEARAAFNRIQEDVLTVQLTEDERVRR